MVVINGISASVDIKPFAILAPSTNTYDIAVTSSAVNTSSGDFILHVTASTYSASYSCSMDVNSDDYIVNAIGTTPFNNKLLYVYSYSTINSALSMGSDTASLQKVNDGIMLSGSGGGYATDSTPFIKSQLGNDLFKFYGMGAGSSGVYISIANIKFASEVVGSDYGTFTVLVRKVGDTDLKPIVLESFTNVTMDRTSVNFIGRKIGDQWREYSTNVDGESKLYVYGEFDNKSKYVRVEVASNYAAIEVPYGFGAYTSPVSGSSTELYTVTKRIIQKTSGTDIISQSNAFNFKYYLGFDWTIADNAFVSKPINKITNPTLNETTFSLAECYVPTGGSLTTTSSSLWTTLTSTTLADKFRKFNVALQGGFDGFNPTVTRSMAENITSTNVMGLDCSTVNSSGTTAYKMAIDTVGNPDEFDINMLVLPGIINNYHGSVITYANDMSEERGDTFFLFDCVGLSDSIQDAVDSIAGIDSNYSATYYPWIKIYDNTNGKYMWVPTTVVMTAVIAFNDRVSAPWYAPAGLNRGGITEATQVYTRLTQGERDTLYDNRINPITTFIGQGIVAWGQKTLQVKHSALDRINVRRLLIDVKKYIASSTKYLVFEGNTATTRQRFLNMVNPYLESVQQKQGLYSFKVVMDESNNTAEVIDRNQMIGDIWLQPTKSSEIVIINFNVTATGAEFSV
jgi:hypothetical protein